MTLEETYNQILKLTENELNAWRSHWGYALPDASQKIDKLSFDWTIELTRTLSYWVDKNLSMTDGDLILSSVTIGTLVENMMLFVLCVFSSDYSSNCFINQKGKKVKIEDLSFNQLIEYMFTVVWTKQHSPSRASLFDEMEDWVKKLKYRRNCIHLFDKSKERLGDYFDFDFDIETYYRFIQLVFSTLPDDPFFD